MTPNQNELFEDRWKQPQIDNLNELMLYDSSREVLDWATENFMPRLTFVCRFTVEDVVTLHMLAQLKDQPKIVFLDTGRFDQETYDLIERCRERFDFDLTVYTPKHKSLGRLLSDYGLDPAASHAEYGRQCCAVRKAEPLRRALQGADAWLSGIRRDQDPAQTHGGILQIDQVHGGILKIHPLYQWSRQEVWDYLHEHKLPYHKCYDEGFSRIECAPCIRLATEQNDHGARSHWWEPGAEPEAPTQLSRMTVVQVS